MIQRLRRIANDRQGSVLMITALGILFMTAIAGAGIDFGRFSLVKLRAQQAADAAALAVATMPDTKADGSPVTDADRGATVARYFSLNYPANYLGVDIPASNISATFGESISVTVDGINMPTTFARFVGLDSMAIHATNKIGQISSRDLVPYDLVLVIDTSSSMQKNDVGTVGIREVPAGRLPEVLSAAQNYCVNTMMSIHLYDFSDALRGCTDAASNPDYYITNERAGLVGPARLNAVRASAYDLSQRILGTSGSTQSRVAVITWTTETYFNTLFSATGPVPTANNNPYAILDQMFAFGSTNSSVGLKAAQDRLASDSDRTHVRAVVLLTDGSNTYADVPIPAKDPGPQLDKYGCNGGGGGDPAYICPATAPISLGICSALKNDGVLVYTVAFGQDVIGVSGPQIQSFLSSCASGAPGANLGSFYFLAPDAASLSDAFKIIATSIKKVKIVE